MDCYKSSWAAEVAAGRAAGTEYSASPCATCPAGSEGGKIMLSYDDGKAVPAEPQAAGEAGELYPLSVLGDALRMLFAMPSADLEVVRLRYAGLPYASIARKLGLRSEGAAMVRMSRVLKATPVLLSLFPRKAKARQVRKERLRALSRRAKRVSGGKGT